MEPSLSGQQYGSKKTGQNPPNTVHSLVPGHQEHGSACGRALSHSADRELVWGAVHNVQQLRAIIPWRGGHWAPYWHRILLHRSIPGVVLLSPQQVPSSPGQFVSLTGVSIYRVGQGLYGRIQEILD
ncbi:hypothetical protein NFI96_025149 [Prochilodus magdalenae]|nr:hypothetical protein NFI96_025149 [Prochilodus magdalenae]